MPIIVSTINMLNEISISMQKLPRQAVKQKEQPPAHFEIV